MYVAVLTHSETSVNFGLTVPEGTGTAAACGICLHSFFGGIIIMGKTVIVTGAAGFAGGNLTLRLAEKGYRVKAVVRKGSSHNKRIEGIENIELIELDMSEISRLPEYINEECDVFYHLAWAGKPGLDGQYENVVFTLNALKAAKAIGCRRFLATGSQAEYGLTNEIQREDLFTDPVTAYGSTKVAACFLSRNLADELGIEWIWARIFSVYGRFEPMGRHFTDLIYALLHNEPHALPAGTENWDYLDGVDCADALIALAEKGRSGEIYNVADGRYKPRREFYEIVRDLTNPDYELHFGKVGEGGYSEGYMSLQPDMSKTYNDTGWRPQVDFVESAKLEIEDVRSRG